MERQTESVKLSPLSFVPYHDESQANRSLVAVALAGPQEHVATFHLRELFHRRPWSVAAVLIFLAIALPVGPMIIRRWSTRK